MTSESERDEFLDLVDSHGPAVFAMLRRLCGNVHDAEDAFQDTAVRVWRSFSNRPRLRNPRAWLMTIAYRAFVDHRARRVPAEALVDVPDPRSDPPDVQAERSDECRRLSAAMEGLPDTMRQILVLHYTGGLTIRQTAELLGVSEGTVKSRLNAALSRLRSILQ